MSLNLTDEEITGLIAYARGKFATEPYPFAPALRPIREALAKRDPKPTHRALAAAEGLCAEPSADEEEQATADGLRLGHPQLLVMLSYDA